MYIVITLMVLLVAAIGWCMCVTSKRPGAKNILHVMVDLETLSLKPNAYIRSVGAVVFDTDGVSKERFYESCDGPEQPGSDIDQNTVEWWNNQTPEAKEALQNYMHNDLNGTLERFKQWVNDQADYMRSCLVQQGDKPRVEVWMWSNGADFDTVILMNAYKRIGIEQPWEWYNARCYRTLKSIFKNIRREEFQGTRHDALADAEYQAEHASRIIKHIYI